MTTPTIVIPLDGSEHALVAIPVAKRLAELESATLHIVHVAGEVAPPADVLATIGLERVELHGCVLDTRVGDAATGIIDAARDRRASLIVMCTHTAATPVARTLGRTALAVLAAAPCPVVFVHPERGAAPWDLRRVLLPHDGTPTTNEATGPAAEIARRAGAELTVLHVAAPGARLPAEHGCLTAPRYTDQPQHEWPAWAGEFVERLGSVAPLESLRVKMALELGVPGDEVVRYAAEHASDLIVLVWRHDWDEDRALTTKTILRRAGCPVMVIGA